MHDKIQIFTERDSGQLQAQINDYLDNAEGAHDVEILMAQSSPPAGSTFVNYTGVVRRLSRPVDDEQGEKEPICIADAGWDDGGPDNKLDQLEAIFKSFKSSVAFGAPEMFDMHIDTLYERVKGLFD